MTFILGAFHAYKDTLSFYSLQLSVCYNGFYDASLIRHYVYLNRLQLISA